MRIKRTSKIKCVTSASDPKRTSGIIHRRPGGHHQGNGAPRTLNELLEEYDEELEMGNVLAISVSQLEPARGQQKRDVTCNKRRERFLLLRFAH